jgi:four helix bundle protein
VGEPTIQRFEDLVAWQRARTLTKDVYLLTRERPFSGDFGLSGQIQRASVSIMANIAEGFERGNRAEFHQFLSVAKASCAEVRSHLYVASDIGYLSDVEFGRLRDQAEEVTRIVAGLRSAVARQRDTQRPKPSPKS